VVQRLKTSDQIREPDLQYVYVVAGSRRRASQLSTLCGLWEYSGTTNSLWKYTGRLPQDVLPQKGQSCRYLVQNARKVFYYTLS
jgi:hypothetical protein